MLSSRQVVGSGETKNKGARSKENPQAIGAQTNADDEDHGRPDTLPAAGNDPPKRAALAVLCTDRWGLAGIALGER